MQYVVPNKNFKKRFSFPIKSIFALILTIFFIFVIMLVLSTSRKAENCFDKEIYYFVYAEKKKNAIKKDNIDLIKNLGGAGKVYIKQEKFYLLVNVYLKEDDANEISADIYENFKDSGVISIKVDEISKQIKSKIKDNSSFYRFFKYLQKTIESMELLNINYQAGKITDGKLINNMLEIKLEFETLLKEMKAFREEQLFDNIITYAKQIVNYFNDFFDEFYISTKKLSLMCAFYVNFVLLKVDLFNNL